MTTPPPKRRRTPWHYILLWLIAIASLVFNIVLVSQLFTIRNQARTGIEDAAIALESAEFPNLSFPVTIDETIPISLTVPFNDVFTVPISETIPVSLTIPFQDEVVVPINDVIQLNNSITVDIVIPILNQTVPLPIPINTNIPIVLDVVVPISQTIPIQTNIPINLMIDVPVSAEFPIQTDVPVQLTVPVNVPVEELGLAAMMSNIADALRSLADSLK
jgi:hypothetical protein